MTLKAGMADALRTIIAAGRLADARGREPLGAALAVLFGATADAGITPPDLDVDDVLMTLAGHRLRRRQDRLARAGRADARRGLRGLRPHSGVVSGHQPTGRAGSR